MDGKMANPIPGVTKRGEGRGGLVSRQFRDTLILLLAGTAIHFGTIFGPASLMDDVDAVNAQIAREMLASGDWITAHINGVVYLEKSPLGYWLMAVSYALFGVHDWAARIPFAAGSVALMLVTAALARWGFGSRAGLYAGLALGSSVGLFLFTRICIPDVLLTLAITFALYCFLRTLCDQARGWVWGFWASVGVALLLKGLLGALVPLATAFLYLAVRRKLFQPDTWRLMCPWKGLLLTGSIFAPWVFLAAWRNPPWLDFTLHSDPGVYRGFFWFYFINEHVLRFLNLRYPRDYNTVPRAAFWLLHLVWWFPWSVFLAAASQPRRFLRSQKAQELGWVAILWIGFLLVFLSFSTTQEYYSMPCYPAFAVLLGAILAEGSEKLISAGYGILAGMGGMALLLSVIILYLVRNVPAGGDISSALTNNPEAYTLSLGHIQDLTVRSFAYLRGPLLMAGLAFGVGALLAWHFRRRPSGPIFLTLIMALFFHAANWALGVFNPYLSSRPLAEAIKAGPPGQLILEGHFYPASSVGFYTGRPALLLNGKVDNLVYGAAAPNAPPVFIDDAQLARLWKEPRRFYLVAPAESRQRLEKLLPGALQVYVACGGKCVFTNHP
jgi:4-amino-4-deoxy-L-arabinose transferase-like glycosyltransferase